MNIYYKLFKGKWLFLLFTVLAVLIWFVVSNQRATAQPQEDGTLVLSVEDKATGISYVIGVDNLNKEINGIIEYEKTSMEGLEKYREFNNQVLATMMQEVDAADSIPVRITFNSPLKQAEFTEFVEKYEMDVEHYIIYMLESDGKLATIQGSPSAVALVPEADFRIVTNSISQEYNNGDTQFLGWVEVNGTVQVEHVPAMQADQHVFLVGVMELFLEAKLTDELLAEAGIAWGMRRELLQVGFTDITQSTVAWNLYHLGLPEIDSSQ